MVQETVSPMPQFQGCWKLPGGLADPGEDFMQTARREVFEETGVDGEEMGIVTLRHSHGYRFGQGDVYVTVRRRRARRDGGPGRSVCSPTHVVCRSVGAGKAHGTSPMGR